MTHFTKMKYNRPDIPEYVKECKEIIQSLPNDYLGQLNRWNDLRKTISTLQNISYIKYSLNTQDLALKEEKTFFDRVLPDVEEANVSVIKALLASPEAKLLDQTFGPRLRLQFEMQLKTFDPKIKEHLIKEAELTTKYTVMIASAKIPFRGEVYNLSRLAKFFSDDDRKTRKEAYKLYHDFFKENEEALDQIYDELVLLRHEKAQILGYESYIPYIYNAMNRLDYGEKDVDLFRSQVVEFVVPAAQKIRNEQKENLGVDELMLWDLPLMDLKGAPKPIGDGKYILDQSQKMYKEFSKETGDFFDILSQKGLYDLEAYDGKDGGGYCTSLDDYGLPFIFSNFNGTKGDILVMTHECGHAFQYYMSRNQPIMEYLWPTMEAAEIYSMGMEYLTWPWMENFFGADADRFCKQHLKESICLLPYICCVDEFQHEVFKNPKCGAKERKNIWKKLEKKYLPWQNFGELSYWNEGNMWQAKHHIYNSPFYYIDYGLASICAMQLHLLNQENPDNALKSYLEGCKLGGSQSFSEIVAHMSLKNPLNEKCLNGIVGKLAIE
ncbi:M3 family oligoendopeptidase [Chlamydiales bacterium]|nr:M3 family oligoendopeptidase [Chlamydiales bacterium]